MQIVYVMMVIDKPLKVFNFKKTAKQYVEWFTRMQRHDASDYTDYQDYLDLDLNLTEYDVDNITIIPVELI